MSKTTGIIFSRNRPLQLDATIRSLLMRTNIDDLVVIHKYDGVFEYSIKELEAKYGDRVRFVKQGNFITDTYEAVYNGGDYTVFFTDDLIITRYFDKFECEAILGEFNDIVCFSLRLGVNLTKCYSLQISQPLPEFIPNEYSILKWYWRSGVGDWGYPLSVDGHVFRKNFVLALLKVSDDAKTPNFLESKWSTFSGSIPMPIMASFKYSCLVNVPHNRVQDDFKNRNEGGVPEHFLRLFEQGFRIDVGKLYGFNNASCHQPISFDIYKEDSK